MVDKDLKQKFQETQVYLNRSRSQLYAEFEDQKILMSPNGRGRVEVAVYSKDLYDPSWSLSELQEFLDKQVEVVPEEFRGNVTVGLFNDSQYHSITLTVNYWRMETDDEMLPRLTRRTELLNGIEANKRAADLAQLAELTSRYD
jgi:hypothetical protein